MVISIIMDGYVEVRVIDVRMAPPKFGVSRRMRLSGLYPRGFHLWLHTSPDQRTSEERHVYTFPMNRTSQERQMGVYRSHRLRLISDLNVS